MRDVAATGEACLARGTLLGPLVSIRLTVLAVVAAGCLSLLSWVLDGLLLERDGLLALAALLTLATKALLAARFLGLGLDSVEGESEEDEEDDELEEVEDELEGVGVARAAGSGTGSATGEEVAAGWAEGGGTDALVEISCSSLARIFTLVAVVEAWKAVKVVSRAANLRSTSVLDCLAGVVARLGASRGLRTGVGLTGGLVTRKVGRFALRSATASGSCEAGRELVRCPTTAESLKRSVGIKAEMATLLDGFTP